MCKIEYFWKNTLFFSKNKLKTVFIILSLMFSLPAFSLILPFDSSDTWTICQGYNTTELDHANQGGTYGNTGVYSLDFVTDPNPARGSYGCTLDGSSKGKTIIAPGSGKVTVSNTGPGEFICIALDNPDGEIRSINIGHLAQGSLKTGDSVVLGQKIGVLGQPSPGWGDPHIHISLWSSSTCGNGNNLPFNNVFSGYDLSAKTDSVSGALLKHQHYGEKLRASLVPVSEIDGAGSLVDPGNSKDCTNYGNFGCSKDTVRLHPHSTSSTALFQVLKQYGQCDYVRVSGLKEAYISVKGWSEQYPGETGLGNSAIYKADALPADIPLTNSDWSIIAVTTTVPIPANSIRDINLECVGGFGIQSWQLKKLTADISSTSNAVARKLSTQGGYSWGGNGSLITFSNNQIINDTRSNYGRYRDVAKTISGVNAGTIAVFQVYNSPTYACNKLIISNSLVNSSATISWKSWAKATWTGVSTKLPYTLLLNGSDYSIIKIEGNFNASNLNATCSP